jgi:oxygen-independent coproporphyrinogen-3 oxidase
LDREAELRAGQAPLLTTIHIGGGTPSLLGPAGVVALAGVARRRFEVAPDAEVTIEANPLDVTPALAESCLRAGFNRISIGVQSTDREDLRFLGRRHQAHDGPAAVATAHRAGFDTISIDLIYGLPDVSTDDLERRLAEAVESCRPQHVSCYQLTYAPDTPLGRDLAAGRVRRLSDDQEYDLFMLVHEQMDRLGFAAYEVSNFAQASRYQSHHNLNYWRHRDYIGLGPAAHSFRSPARWWNAPSVSLYLGSLEQGRLPEDGRETLSADQVAVEEVMLALRTTDGLDLDAHRRRFGRDLLVEKCDAIRSWAAQGKVVIEAGRLQPTRAGLAIADALAQSLA